MPKGGWQEFSSADSLQRPSAAAKPTPKTEQMVRVQPTRGGKGGKTVTVIRGLELDGPGFKALLKKLKTRIGSGGTAKDGVIELQGVFPFSYETVQVVEEGAKFLGIAAWLAFWCHYVNATSRPTSLDQR